jgi:hypothetical protein
VGQGKHFLISPTIRLEVEVSLPAPPFSVHQMDKLELNELPLSLVDEAIALKSPDLFY